MVPVCKPGQSGPCLFSSHSVCLSLVCDKAFSGEMEQPHVYSPGGVSGYMHVYVFLLSWAFIQGTFSRDGQHD